MSMMNLISLSSAIFIMVLYGLYLFYSSRRNSEEKKLNLLHRVTESLNDELKKANEYTDNGSLLKTSPDSYFKSKLPKIEGLKEWVQHSGLNIKPLTLIIIGITIGVFILFFIFIVLKKNLILSILLSILFGFFLPWIVIAWFTSRRKKQFLEDFPIALDIVRRALRAGHSVDRAISMVAAELSGAVGKSFKEMVDLLKLGKSFEGVLGEMSNRIGIDDFHMLAIVIVLQRETGGSLAETIDNFAKIIRSRQQLRKRVKALTAEVRVTAMILTSIPFFIFGAVYLTTPYYFDPLFETDNGQILLWIGIAMLVIGIGTIARMTYKENY